MMGVTSAEAAGKVKADLNTDFILISSVLDICLTASVDRKLFKKNL